MPLLPMTSTHWHPQAGAKYKGEYEERIKSVLNEVEKAADEGVGVILFIDELHLIMAGRGGEGGGMDAANLFKPLLARGKLRCIGATTLAEYRKYIEKDAALERRFAQVLVNEPSVPETISILRGIREKYEVHHGVRALPLGSLDACTYSNITGSHPRRRSYRCCNALGQVPSGSQAPRQGSRLRYVALRHVKRF
jgi:ATP-dependent Clp protease ATP-binding subunit ClpB